MKYLRMLLQFTHTSINYERNAENSFKLAMLAKSATQKVRFIVCRGWIYILRVELRELKPPADWRCAGGLSAAGNGAGERDQCARENRSNVSQVLGRRTRDRRDECCRRSPDMIYCRREWQRASSLLRRRLCVHALSTPPRALSQMPWSISLALAKYTPPVMPTRATMRTSNLCFSPYILISARHWKFKSRLLELLTSSTY